MEENILFGELNNIKNEIVNDLNILEKLENDIKLRVVCENNKQLSDQVRKLNSEYNERINELKNENLNFKDEHIRLNKIYGDKDGELLKVKKNMRNVIEDNKCLQDSLNSIKSEYLHIEKLFLGRQKEKELLNRNREYLKELYLKENK